MVLAVHAEADRGLARRLRMAARMTIRDQLRRLYESNIRGAQAFGAWWAVDHYRSSISHLDEHPRGPLTARMKRDVAHFGSLIRVR